MKGENKICMSLDTYASLEIRNLLVSESIRLGNDGNQVDFRVQLAHEFNINGLQTAQNMYQRGHPQDAKQSLRVSGGLNEVQAGVDSVVYDLLTVDAVLLLEVGVEPGLNVLDNRFPAVDASNKRSSN